MSNHIDVFKPEIMGVGGSEGFAIAFIVAMAGSAVMLGLASVVTFFVSCRKYQLRYWGTTPTRKDYANAWRAMKNGY